MINYSQQFQIKGAKKHNNKYDYSLANYQGARIPVNIICPIHGTFSQKPCDHLNGNGCQKCGGSMSHTTGSFIEAAKLIHGDKYDYSTVTYIKSSLLVTINCLIHGEFTQTPATHLRGSGCRLCAGKKYNNLPTFVEVAKQTHGDKYDYSHSVYINSETLLTINCVTHGTFQQTPNNHINGKYGCPRCGNAKKNGQYNKRYFEKYPNRKTKPAVLYVIRFASDTESFIKIGITIQDTIRHRFRMTTYDGYVLTVIGKYTSDLYSCWLLEQHMLSVFHPHKHTLLLDRKWSGKHELITIDMEHDIIAFLTNLTQPNCVDILEYLLIDRSNPLK